ncbi:MAG: hypothetical protein ACLR3C_08040 [Eggerthella lenta]
MLAEALLLGAVGVPIGLLAGVAGTAGAFSSSQEAFAAMLGSGSAGLAVRGCRALAAAAALSIATLLVSAWVPSARRPRLSRRRHPPNAGRAPLEARRTVGTIARARRRAREVGIAGRLFGIPGFVAHRNLSRSATRGPPWWHRSRSA